MHRDLFQQAFSAMRHDLRRTLLTMAGMGLSRPHLAAGWRK